MAFQEFVEARPPVYTASEDEHIRRALKYVPADDYDPWIAVGMALHSTGWGEPAFRIFDDWSKTSEKYDAAEIVKKWESFSRPDDSERTLRTLGTLFHLASQHGYVAQHPSVQGEAARTASVSGEADTEDELNQREKLICIGLEADFWHSPNHDTYATMEVAGHEESHPLRSTAFARWLRLESGEGFLGGLRQGCPPHPGLPVRRHGRSVAACRQRQPSEPTSHARLCAMGRGGLPSVRRPSRSL